MPLFCFAFLAASFGLLFALPALTADTIFLFLDRNVGTHFFDVVARRLGAALAAPLLDLRPPRGLHPDRPGVRDRDVDHPGVHAAQGASRSRSSPIAELLVVFIGFGVWAHHMFATGMPTISMVFFAAATAMVVIP